MDDIDYLVGGMLERIIPGSLTSASFRCVLGEGFFRYKAGDRFFYEYDTAPGAFSPGKQNAFLVNVLDDNLSRNKMIFTFDTTVILLFMFISDQLSIIRRFSLSTLICLTGDNIQTMQRNAFLQINPG